MQEELRDIKASVQRIETAIIGDEQAGLEGLASKVNKNATYIERDKKMKWYAGGFIAAVSAFLSWLFR